MYMYLGFVPDCPITHKYVVIDSKLDRFAFAHFLLARRENLFAILKPHCAVLWWDGQNAHSTTKVEFQ